MSRSCSLCTALAAVATRSPTLRTNLRRAVDSLLQRSIDPAGASRSAIHDRDASTIATRLAVSRRRSTPYRRRCRAQARRLSCQTRRSPTTSVRARSTHSPISPTARRSISRRRRTPCCSAMRSRPTALCMWRSSSALGVSYCWHMVMVRAWRCVSVCVIRG